MATDVPERTNPPFCGGAPQSRLLFLGGSGAHFPPPSTRRKRKKRKRLGQEIPFLLSFPYLSSPEAVGEEGNRKSFRESTSREFVPLLLLLRLSGSAAETGRRRRQRKCIHCLNNFSPRERQERGRNLTIFRTPILMEGRVRFRMHAISMKQNVWRTFFGESLPIPAQTLEEMEARASLTTSLLGGAGGGSRRKFLDGKRGGEGGEGRRRKRRLLFRVHEERRVATKCGG